MNLFKNIKILHLPSKRNDIQQLQPNAIFLVLFFTFEKYKTTNLNIVHQ